MERVLKLVRADELMDGEEDMCVVVNMALSWWWSKALDVARKARLWLDSEGECGQEL